MSFWKTLQRQPRTISLFTNDIASNIKSQKCLQLLKGDVSHRFDVEIANRFPTWDQLQYMRTSCPQGPVSLQRQIPKLDSVLKYKHTDRTFGMDLQKCVQRGLWNPKEALWVDWENKLVGNEPADIDKYIIQRK
ncbi:CCQ_1a_G0025890.mRNA.1.CDS.1 [Saccharomyces cerevisiae]|nr:CCQ_1a_G0025890.mRNA.1.CDS.1 [Saccharomyces cerevisiae]CAI7235296.1 CCQ_1a_G0025890.mRNA.1.CDS.1 [Saccharomyces cerevisiae]